MRQLCFRFLLTVVLYYIVTIYAGEILVLPPTIIRMSSFLPPLLGILWGPVVAVGVFCVEMFSDFTMWQLMSQILQQDDMATCAGQAFLLFANYGIWAFVSGYMPYRLWHSFSAAPEEPLFALRTNCLLKFVGITFLTVLATSLILALSKDVALLAEQMKGFPPRFGLVMEYFLLCFLNDFDIIGIFGLMGFFLCIGRRFPFYCPTSASFFSVRWKSAFDMMFLFACLSGIALCQMQTEDMVAWKVVTICMLAFYSFRPMAPHTGELLETESSEESLHVTRKVAALFYFYFLLLFFLLDCSGIIYDLSYMKTWQQFNTECLTMMAIGLMMLVYTLLRYRRSIMMNFVVLVVSTVFITAFALGFGCIVVTDRITNQHLQDSLDEMTVTCRERIKQTFDNIQVSVDDAYDLVVKDIESYERLSTDEAYRQAYLEKAAVPFGSIASNTNGSIAFYMRLAMEYAGPLGGFSYERAKGEWEGERAAFERRTPVGLSPYTPSDMKRMGWYYVPKNRRQPSWIAPYIDPILNAYVVSYVHPIYIGEKFVGVMGMDIDMDYLIHEMRRMSVYKYGHAYLTDRSGRILYHKDYKQGEIFQSNPAFYERETYLIDGIWLGIAMPVHEIYAERNNLLMHLVSIMMAVAILVSFLSINLASRGIRPLLALIGATKEIASGNLEVSFPSAFTSGNELGTLVRSVQEMISKLEIYVYRDNLTGLRNKAAYVRLYTELDMRRKAFEIHYAVIVFDVNFLKRINDNYGHEAGDELIRHAAKVICKVFAHSPVFRIGGDEFTAILENEDYERREELLMAFDEALAATCFEIKGEKTPLSVARGLAVYQEGMEYSEVFQQADEAMYAHKTAIKKKMGVELR